MSDPPKLFVRRIDIPAAAPWDQSQAARLEAEHGAPLGGQALVWSLRRLHPWRPGAPGAFAVAYARQAELKRPRMQAEVDGEAVTFTFSRAGGEARALKLVINAGAVALAVGALALAGARALTMRSEREAALTRLEENVFRWQRQERADRTETLARRLGEAGLEGHGFADLGGDLYWLAQAKAPAARLEPVAWRPGEMVIRASGAPQPIAGQERAVQPLDGKDAGAWRIGSGQRPTIRQGQVRPSVVAERQPSVTGTGR